MPEFVEYEDEDRFAEDEDDGPYKSYSIRLMISFWAVSLMPVKRAE